MARLPLRRRKSKLETVKDLAQLYTTVKLAQAGPRAARRAAKGYAGARAAKAGGRGARRMVGIALAPVAIGGLVAFLKKRNQEPPGYQPVSSPAPSTAASPAATGPASVGGGPGPSAAGGIGGTSHEGETGGSPGFKPPATATPDDTPSMGEPAAPKSGTTSASADSPADDVDDR